MTFDVTDLTRVRPTLDSRAVTFENPTGGRGMGGHGGGRKGAPSRTVEPGERVTLADLDGPGTVRHLWMTFPPSPPERMRAMYLEVFYDDLDAPSVSVPCLDFFGVPHGRPVAYASALTTMQEGRGFNSYLPMPFGEHVRVELVNGSAAPVRVFFQLDYTLGGVDADTGRLHVSFRRQNPTTPREDFVVERGLRGPGRFLGCVLGVRPIDPGYWYGEGEVKVYRDGDDTHPTICGTGLEDYVGSAWMMGAHTAPYAGCPLDVRPPDAPFHSLPDYVGCYRWHVHDPIMYADELTVTVQQIGADFFLRGEEERLAAAETDERVAGSGVRRFDGGGPVIGSGLFERMDDYCATAFTVCARPQPVPPVDVAVATADLERRPYERPSQLESVLP